MVDLIFLYNKNTTKVKISQYNLESSKIDLAKIAKEEASEDEEEVIGLKNADFDQEIEDEEELNNPLQTIDAVLKEVENFRNIIGDEDQRESADNVEWTYLLNFQDTLGRTALHYACFYGSVGVVEDLTFLKANPWIKDVYGNRPIDLIQKGPKYDVLIELLTNNMRVVKDPTNKVNKGSQANESILNNKKKAKGLLRSLDITDIKLIPETKLVSERIGISFDNYIGFSISSNNYEATKYLLSLKLFPLDFRNSAGNSYFHLCILQKSLTLLKLCFIDPDLLKEPYSSKEEIENYLDDNINPEIFKKRIFELISNKKNTILNCCVEYGNNEIFEFLFTIFINYYGTDSKISKGKQILEMEDKNGHSALIKCVLKNQDSMIDLILKNKQMIKESDLFHIANYLQGDKNTKLGSKKETKRLENVQQKKQIDAYVNKIWDYLKDKDAKRMKEYIEERAQIMKEFRPDDEMEQIYSEIVNDQKGSNKYTPLHFAIKFKSLAIIRCLIWDYNADTTIDNKDGHDPIEYLHIGEASHTISAPLMDKIDDLLNKKTKSIRYDKNKVFNQIQFLRIN